MNNIQCFNHFDNSKYTLITSLYNKSIDCILHDAVPISLKEGEGCISTPLLFRAFNYKVVYYENIIPSNLDIKAELVILDIQTITEEFIDKICNSLITDIALICTRDTLQLFSDKRNLFNQLKNRGINIIFTFIHLVGSKSITWDLIQYNLSGVTKQVVTLGSIRDYYNVNPKLGVSNIKLQSVLNPPQTFLEEFKIIMFVNTNMPDKTLITRRDYLTLTEMGNVFLYNNLSNNLRQFPIACQRVHLFYYNSPTYFCINSDKIDLFFFHNLYIFINYMIESFSLINSH